MKNQPRTLKNYKTNLEPWKTNPERWKTMKTNLELYRVVTGGYRWLRRLHRGSDFSGQRDSQTLHHNIYIYICSWSGQSRTRRRRSGRRAGWAWPPVWPARGGPGTGLRFLYLVFSILVRLIPLSLNLLFDHYSFNHQREATCNEALQRVSQETGDSGNSVQVNLTPHKRSL